MKWTHAQLGRLMVEMRNVKPLYLFMAEDESVLDAEFFDDAEQAVDHARTLAAPVVNVLLYVGTADNANEDIHVGPRKGR